MEELKPGDWVRLVNTDDFQLDEDTEHELGKMYQVTKVFDYNDYIEVAGIYLKKDPDFSWQIYTHCFEKINPFQERVRMINDEKEKLATR